MIILFYIVLVIVGFMTDFGAIYETLSLWFIVVLVSKASANVLEKCRKAQEGSGEQETRR